MGSKDIWALIYAAAMAGGASNAAALKKANKAVDDYQARWADGQ